MTSFRAPAVLAALCLAFAAPAAAPAQTAAGPSGTVVLDQPLAPADRGVATGPGGAGNPPVLALSPPTPVASAPALPSAQGDGDGDGAGDGGGDGADAGPTPDAGAASGASGALSGPPSEEELAAAARAVAAAIPELAPDADAAAREQLRQWEQVATGGSAAITSGVASSAAFEVLRETLLAQRIGARAMAERTRAAGDPLRSQMVALGAPPAEGQPEPRAAAVERAAMGGLIGLLDARARQADLAAARADAVIADIDKLIRQRFAQQLLTRGPTPLAPAGWAAAVQEIVSFNLKLGDEIIANIADPVLQRERAERLPLLAVAVVIALIIGLWLRRRLVAVLLRAAPETAGRARRVAVGAMIAATRLLLPAAAAAVMYVGLDYSGILGVRGREMLDLAATGLLLLIAAQGIAWAYYSPANPRFRMSRLDDATSRRAVLLAVLLGVVLAIDQVAVQGGEAFAFSAGALAAMNLCVLGAGSVVMWGLAGFVRPSRDDRGAAKVDADSIAAYAPPGDDDEDAATVGRRLMALGAVAMRIVAVVSVLLAMAGYYAASRYAFFPTALTLGLLAAGVLLFTMIREGVDAYLSDDADTARAGQGAPGKLRLLPILAGFIICLVLVPELALIWGARPADLVEGWALISGGLRLGDATISPVDFLTFALVFAGVYTVTRLFQSILRKSVLPNTSLDSGARNAVASFVGYAGFAMAAIAAVSAAGLDLSSLAIVAGALSVGIGFGLQNVVNNFVSGIILLVERPIKVGDWINVNGTHGTVKKISVRATEIETFDRASLIVPNGDLISSPVMNMTHGNNVGRVIVPVGVAYGSDVQKVQALLTEVSTSHAAVLRYPAPQVLFLAFGADSLNFEIRGILRDIGQILPVTSHWHFEIERRFREAGIEIPFAQRDIHLRNPERIAAAFAAALRAPSPAPSPAPSTAASAAESTAESPASSPAPEAAMMTPAPSSPMSKDTR
jgi:small-conductance mechanosensitive channel